MLSLQMFLYRLYPFSNSCLLPVIFQHWELIHFNWIPTRFEAREDPILLHSHKQYENESYEIGTDSEKPEDVFYNLVENASFDDPSQGRADGSFFKTYKVNSECSKHCDEHCHDTVHSWPKEDSLRLKQNFKSDRIIDTKAKLIQHCFSPGILFRSGWRRIWNNRQFSSRGG